MKLVLAMTFVGWIGGALYFLSAAKSNYCGTTEMVVSPTVLAANMPIVSFEFDRFSSDTSAYFHLLRDSLIGSIGDNQQLRITGRMSHTEAIRDSLLGMKRANAARTLFAGYLNLSEIDIASVKSTDALSIQPLFEIVPSYLSPSANLPMGTSTAVNSQPSPEKEVVEEVIEEETTVEVAIVKEVKEEVIPNKEVAPDALYVIYFKENSSVMISPSEVQNYITDLEQKLKQSKEKIVLVGFDDDGRSSAESIELAKRRTWRVRSAFKDKQVRRKLVNTQNKGQSESNSNDDSKNRRVEIRILK